MCVIITGQSKKPALSDLLACEGQNSDGGGMAWATPKGVEFRKGLDAREMHQILKGLKRQTPWVVHFRFATVGEAQPGLCHPFPIDRMTDLNLDGVTDQVLFHNGTVRDWKERVLDFALDPKVKVTVPAGEWSDSRAVAWLLALNDSIRPLRFMEGKFVVLGRKGAKVFPEGGAGWSNRGGCLFSNLNWTRHLGGKPKQSYFRRNDSSGLLDEAKAWVASMPLVPPPSMPTAPKGLGPKKAKAKAKAAKAKADLLRVGTKAAKARKAESKKKAGKKTVRRGLKLKQGRSS